MTDFLFVLIIVGFFGLAVLFVRLCETIVGDGTSLSDDAEASTDDTVVAS